jgi:hypothetical protein
LEELGVDGRILLKRILDKWHGSMDWIDLYEAGEKWLVLLNSVINLPVP